jgi:hypothetical protein
MIEVILLSVFIISAAGAGIILARQMPVAQRSATVAGLEEAANFGQAAKNLCLAGIKRVPCFRDFNWLDFVQKILMKGRVVVLKAENKINDYMLRLRQKAEENRDKEAEVLDNYWHDLKTIVKTKNPMHHAEAKAVTAQSELIAKEKSVLPEEVNVRAAIAQAQAQMESVQPAINRVVMPEEGISNNHSQHHKKKRGFKKRKFKDPFQW